MGQSTSSAPAETTHVNEIMTPTESPPLPVITPLPKRRQSLGKHLKKLLKCFAFSCRRTTSSKKRRKHAKANKMDMLLTSHIFTDTNVISSPTASPELQLHWLRSKHSLLSYALSKLAFFSRLSKERLKEEEKDGNTLKFYRDKNGNVSKRMHRLSLSQLSSNGELRTRLIHKILSQHSSVRGNISAAKGVNGGTLRKIRSPQEIYERNLKKFERLVAITASTSSSSTSQDECLKNVFENAKTVTKQTVTFQEPDENNNIIRDVDENENPVAKKVEENFSGIGGSGSNDNSLLTTAKLPPRRVITTSKTPVEVDVYFMDWVKKKVESSSDSPKTGETETTVGHAEVTTTSSTASSSDSTEKKHPAKDKNNNDNPPPPKEKFEYLKKGQGKRASVGGRNQNKSKSPGKSGRNTDTSTTTRTTTTTTEPTTANTSDYRRCDKCGPCAGKEKLKGAPPAYLDYGVCGAANAAGEAWKGKRKGDPVMDRLKNVDVVEEMTYMVPNPDCCGGNGDGCDEVEEDDCDYYAVCESCGEMEPVPEELKRELKQRKKKKEKIDKTPVTYSRRQRFNFKNKGDMCDDEDGPPYTYEGLQCPGCRCPCCLAGLRRDPGCGCKCCQSMGPARKCNSFDEMPVGKNPQIRRILCPEEECARRRQVCKQLMPDTSGMYRFDVCEQMFERQVPRTPTPIVVEVEAPAPLTNEQLLALGREIQETKRLGIGVDAYCPRRPVEQDPMYLPPIYGQCNPPVCQPCQQPCCAPNYCCGQQEEEKKTSGSTYGSNYYGYTGSEYSYSGYGYTGQSGTGNQTNTTTKAATEGTTEATPTGTVPQDFKQVKANSESSESLPEYKYSE